MLLAIFDCGVNLLFESVIHVSIYVCVYVYVGYVTRGVWLACDITGYAIINRFIAVPSKDLLLLPNV